MKKINYEPIIAGALLKFESLDNVDFSLLIIGLEDKLNIEVRGSWSDSPNNLGKYIETLDNGTIKLRDGISLDDFIEEENCTLREKLLEVAGNKVANYFNHLDIEKYKIEKEKTLKDNKEKVLNEANVLLISDIQDDYDELVKYGFKNVDYFKSIIRADSYFAEHPEKLEKYHIILKGNQNVQHCCFEGDVELDRTINRLRDKKHILKSSLHRYDFSDHIELVTHLSDRINRRSWNATEFAYQGIFDRIVENMLMNHTLKKVDLKGEKFIPIQDYINPNRLPLPTKKTELKILYLDPVRVSKYAERIAKELGLSVDFKEDDNCSLGRYVKSNLGKYDIIIVSRVYSDNLLSMNHESTEQCKDTGKELTLLVAQNDLYWGVDRDLADGIKLGYVFGGNYAPDSEYHSKEIRILRQPIEVDTKDEYWIKHEQSQYSKMKGIIEASVNFYNQALLQRSKPAISDLDFKTAEELDQDYVDAYKNKEAVREAELAPIRLFDNIRYSIISYLNYKKNGLINQIPEGLKIIEDKDGIKVENIYQGRTLCAIVFPKEYKHEDLRIFQIQTLSKKGKLSSPQTIGVYTNKYENLESIPDRPDEKQASALLSIEKKINVALRPLNEEAWKKQLEQETQEPKTLNLKRNNKKRRRKWLKMYNS